MSFLIISMLFMILPLGGRSTLGARTQRRALRLAYRDRRRNGTLPLPTQSTSSLLRLLRSSPSAHQLRPSPQSQGTGRCIRIDLLT